MNVAEITARRAYLWCAILLISLGLIAGFGVVTPWVTAQETGPQPPEMAAGEQDSDDAPGVREARAEFAPGEEETTQQGAAEEQPELKGDQDANEMPNLLELFWKHGGKLMWPIMIMSMLVVTFGCERAIGLRRRKVLPPELIGGLGRLAGQKGGLDPRQAYKLCQQYPSAAASVIKTMLLKVGRPHTELEHAVTEANEREAARLYANVRWLSMAAGVTPLLGLLGTVWGMILAFFRTAHLPLAANKAEFLAGGIYVALLTTFAGLSVAIPAAILAHLYEGRIQSLFRELDETLLGLMPQLERFEGRLRVSKDQMEVSAVQAPAAAPAAANQGQQQPAAAPK